MNIYKDLPINGQKNPLSEIKSFNDTNRSSCCLISKTGNQVGKAAMKRIRNSNNTNKDQMGNILLKSPRVNDMTHSISQNMESIQQISQSEYSGSGSNRPENFIISDKSESKDSYEGGESTDQFDLQKYKFLLKEYSSEKFITDLTRAIRFDDSKIRRKCPLLIKKKFTFTDLSLQRPVHIYEHIILLAHGYCRPGFLKLICNTEQMTEKDINLISEPFNCGQNPFYDALVTFVYAFQGDLGYFKRH